MYDAKIVADSISPQGHRITTMEVVMPRIVLAEFNTHRMLSRNSASSRAIPFKKMVNMVMTTPFVPLKWMKEHTGMQGTEYFTDEEVQDSFIQQTHFIMRDLMVKYAEMQNRRGVTKQLCNRYLEPFMWHKVLVTATEWENFYALRHDPAAEIHIQRVAELMLHVQNESTPKQLKAGEWHIPYGDKIDLLELATMLDRKILYGSIADPVSVEDCILQIATARCAQTSYTVIDQDEKPMDYAKLIALHDRLLKSGHMSPFEHCARCMTEWEYEGYGYHIPNPKGPSDNPNYGISTGECGWCGNFRGWIQYRKLIPGENRSDPRLIKKEVTNG